MPKWTVSDKSINPSGNPWTTETDNIYAAAREITKEIIKQSKITDPSETIEVRRKVKSTIGRIEEI